MPANKIFRFAALSALVCIAISALLMAGCSQQIQQQNEEKPVTPSSYMVELNSYTEDLKTKLQEFSEAVSDDKLSAMQTKAAEADALIDQIKDLPAPDSEDFAPIHDGYMEAMDKLKEALSSYIDLYIDIQDASKSDPFDYSTYSSRLESIQKLYDEGLEELADADSKAQES